MFFGSTAREVSLVLAIFTSSNIATGVNDGLKQKKTETGIIEDF